MFVSNLFSFETADLLTATIDLDLAEQVRAKLPVFVGRRPLLYTA